MFKFSAAHRSWRYRLKLVPTRAFPGIQLRVAVRGKPRAGLQIPIEENGKTPVIVNLQFSLPPPSHIIVRRQQTSAQRPFLPLSLSIEKYKAMGRRARSGSNTNNTQIIRNNAGNNTNLNQPRAVDNEFPIPTAAGMSPGSRYNHNLKVLRRRDPSIVSIFDQFSHVCLYHHNGEKWEKKGYEGSMFLYERYACCTPEFLALL